MATRLLAIGVLVLASWPAGASTPDAQGMQPCVVASDAAFGRTPDSPIKVGGGAAYAGARERRYLDALRAPTGEPVAYKRLGSMPASPNSETILDHYEVTVPGLDAPVSLYLDAYHFEQPRAPQGFSCVEFRVGPPPVEPFLAIELQRRLAVEYGGTHTVEPLALDPVSSVVAFDRFRVVALHAAAAAASGTPLDPNGLPAGLQRAGLVLVARPIPCGTGTLMPATIDIVPRQGQPVRRGDAALTPEQLTERLPGAAHAPAAVAFAFALPAFRPTDSVRVTYTELECEGRSSTVVLPVQFTPARALEVHRPALPEGAALPDGPIWFQAVVDLEGRLTHLTHSGGSEDAALVAAARAAVATWRAEPARVNGSPVVADTMIAVSFEERGGIGYNPGSCPVPVAADA